jgi:hypothetical protein
MSRLSRGLSRDSRLSSGPSLPAFLSCFLGLLHFGGDGDKRVGVGVDVKVDFNVDGRLVI